MEGAGDARREWGDDRQGHRRENPHAQDQGLAGGGAPRAAQAGCPAREPCRSRESLLTLTPAGRSIYEELAPRALDFMDRLFEVVALPDRPAFDRAMKQLTRRSAELVAQGEPDKGENRPARLKRRDRTVLQGGHVKLYTYFRSSAAYRVRIALNLKGLVADQARSTCRRRAAQQEAAISRRQSSDAGAGAQARFGRCAHSVACHHGIPRRGSSRSPRCCRVPRWNAQRCAPWRR